MAGAPVLDAGGRPLWLLCGAESQAPSVSGSSVVNDGAKACLCTWATHVNTAPCAPTPCPAGGWLSCLCLGGTSTSVFSGQDPCSGCEGDSLLPSHLPQGDPALLGHREVAETVLGKGGAEYFAVLQGPKAVRACAARLSGACAAHVAGGALCPPSGTNLQPSGQPRREREERRGERSRNQVFFLFLQVV